MAQAQSSGITVTIAGSAFRLDRALVTKTVEGVLPDPLNEHFVVVGGRRFPPKQVIGLVTGLDRSDFTTHQARRTLRRLGFPVGRRPPVTVPEPARREPDPDAEAQVEALRPYIGQWVALKDNEVLVASAIPEEVLDWLERHDMYADGMFRVPDKPETWDVPAVGPF